MLVPGPRSGLKYARERAAGAPGCMKTRFGLSRRSRRAEIRSVKSPAAMVCRRSNYSAGGADYGMKLLLRNRVGSGSCPRLLR
jgi:hypothetical protein